MEWKEGKRLTRDGDCSESKVLENREVWVDGWMMKIFLHECRNWLCCEEGCWMDESMNG
jgi:hypothetical protein